MILGDKCVYHQTSIIFEILIYRETLPSSIVAYEMARTFIQRLYYVPDARHGPTSASRLDIEKSGSLLPRTSHLLAPTSASFRIRRGGSPCFIHFTHTHTHTHIQRHTHVFAICVADPRFPIIREKERMDYASKGKSRGPRRKAPARYDALSLEMQYSEQHV